MVFLSNATFSASRRWVRPNIVGVTTAISERLSAMLTTAKQVIPNLKKVALLISPDWPKRIAKTFIGESKKLKVDLDVFFANSTSQKCNVVVESTKYDLLIYPWKEFSKTYFDPASSVQFITLAHKLRVPVMTSSEQLTEKGGLMSLTFDQQNRHIQIAVEMAKNFLLFRDQNRRFFSAKNSPKLFINSGSAKHLRFSLSKKLRTKSAKIFEIAAAKHIPTKGNK